MENLSALMLPAIEEELRRAIALTDRPGLGELYSMLAYHLGWDVEGASPAASGKRIRPFLTLLVASAAGGDWKCALPAAAAIELIHNFSLIHDDIEDRSPLRRGRPAVWQKWGIAQAINTGDTMFTLAHLALLRLEETTTPQIALKAARILQETALRLTEGQHLDIAYETRPDLQPEGYWSMIGGKTAALLSASAEIGALAARAGATIQESYRQFGNDLGLAFQVQDDLLGIWGNIEVTGKSIESDLVTGKKSLPVLYGLNLGGPFARRWLQGSILPEEVPALARQLEEEGARLYAQDHANRLTGQSLLALEQAHPQGEAGQALTELAGQLLNRRF